MKNSDFGVIIPCHKGDLWLAKSALESIDYFTPGLPRCLLVDGDCDVSKLASRYGAKVIYRRHVPELFLAKGYKGTHSKMAAFWHSPYERFLMMDADAVLWGDIAKVVADLDFDILVHGNGYIFPLPEVKHWFYDPEIIVKYFPDFQPHGAQLACSGVFCARKRIIPNDLFEKALDVNEKEPGSFFIGEQGYLSFLFQLLSQRGLANLKTADMQYVESDYGYEETKSRFPIRGSKPFRDNSAPQVLHYAGPNKPLRKNKNVYSDPVTFFRLNAFRRKGFVFKFFPLFFLNLEDFLLDNFYKRTIWHRIQRRIQLALQPLFAILN